MQCPWLVGQSTQASTTTSTEQVMLISICLQKVTNLWSVETNKEKGDLQYIDEQFMVLGMSFIRLNLITTHTPCSDNSTV